MIDFRYHLISIIAVFLALAIGIVLGTTALNSALLDDLRTNIQGLTQDKDDLRTQVADLEARLEDAGAFTEGTAPALLSGRLAGRQVVLVAAPRAPTEVREAVARAVEEAEGEVVGPVLLQSDYLTRDPEELEEIVDRLTPAGVSLPAGTPAERLAALLAGALVTRDTGGSVADGGDSADADTTAVLEGLREAGLLRVQGETPGPAALAVLVSAPGPGADAGVDEAVLDRDRDALLALALALRRGAAAAVVAGPDDPAGRGGLLDDLRADRAVAEQVSGVDDAGSPQGRIATVLALLEAWRGETGQYGRGSRASGPLPLPLPAALPDPAEGAEPAEPLGLGASAGTVLGAPRRDLLGLHPLDPAPLDPAPLDPAPLDPAPLP